MLSLMTAQILSDTTLIALIPAPKCMTRRVTIATMRNSGTQFDS